MGYCNDIVRRNSILVIHGSLRVEKTLVLSTITIIMKMNPFLQRKNERFWYHFPFSHFFLVVLISCCYINDRLKLMASIIVSGC